ncbi:MAG TPA: GDP-mannose 4,6-dehydratase [Phycisphaerae bacterium]|nr:GDP-mannose 4,6-dehydratase [Phycisphaerae bacterium]
MDRCRHVRVTSSSNQPGGRGRRQPPRPPTVGSGGAPAGSLCWIHVVDHCDALIRVLQDGQPGEIYNIGADNELSNLELTRAILQQLKQNESMIQRVKDRPGHDWRYAIDAGKMRCELGWSPQVDFEQGLAQTVQWYVDKRPWWQAVKSGEYRNYYQRQHGVGAVVPETPTSGQ